MRTPGRPARVLVLDSDGVNPYGAELAALLVEAGARVTFIAPRDTEFPRQGERCLPLREARTAPTRMSLVRECKSVLLLAVQVAFGRPVIAVWARSYMQVLLSLLAVLPWTRLAYILHNPVPGRRLVGVRGRLERSLMRRVLVIVHSAAYVDAATRHAASVLVVPHLPYRRFCEHHGLLGRSAVSATADEPTFLILGSIRDDKFSVSQLQALVCELKRRNVSGRLIVAVRPRVEISTRPSTLEIDDRSSYEFLTDDELAICIREADVLLAPYANATESGTVQLVLSAGRAVIAFDVGILAESLPRQALVPAGDFAAFAQRCREFREQPWAPGQAWLDRRSAASMVGWREVIAELGPRSLEPRGDR